MLWEYLNSDTKNQIDNEISIIMQNPDITSEQLDFLTSDYYNEISNIMRNN